MARSGKTPFDLTKGLIRFDSQATATSLQAAARRANGTFTPFNQCVRRANVRAIEFLIEEAVENLEKSIEKNGRDQRAATGKLEAAIRDPSSHHASVQGFLFMRDDQVRKKVPYYRAIERGSTHMVGRSDIGILYLKGNRYKQAGIGPTRLRSGNYANTPGSQYVKAEIKRPIKAYSYASKARRRMLSQRLYQTWLSDELEKKGFSVVFASTAGESLGE